MKTKYYLLSALLGGIVIFVWGAFSHMALPWWDDVVNKIPNEPAVVDAMKNAGVQNGMYYGMQGIFLVTFFGQGMSDGAGMAGPMLMEFITDMLVALGLAWLLLRANVRGMARMAGFAGIVGLVTWLNFDLSQWIWYHFPFGYVLLDAVDAVIGTFLAGLVIGWLLKRSRTPGAVEYRSARLAA